MQQMQRLLLTIIMSLIATSAWAGTGERYITVYGGKYTDEPFDDIVRNRTLKLENSYIAVLAVSKVIFQPHASYQWELEGQVVKHFRDQTHWEFNVAPIFRWKRFPWNDYLKTTLAIGDGLSYATEIPPLEESSRTNVGATRLLNYLVIEFTTAPPQVHNWSIVARIHHRSGIFGLFEGVEGGSNILSAGLKFAF